MIYAVVTGASSGIGADLTILLSYLNIHVIAVGRNADKLQTVKEQCAPNFTTTVSADITTEEGRRQITQTVKECGSLQYLILNAGILGPLKYLSSSTPAELRATLDINVEAPLWLTVSLLPFMKISPSARILHIGSGKAHTAQAGLGAYCISKSAFFMLHSVLKLELQEQKLDHIAIGSVRPGAVATPMHEKLRQENEIESSRVQFVQLQKDRKLFTTETVAKFVAWILLEMEQSKFTEKEHDIREDVYRSFWEFA